MNLMVCSLVVQEMLASILDDAIARIILCYYYLLAEYIQQNTDVNMYLGDVIGTMQGRGQLNSWAWACAFPPATYLPTAHIPRCKKNPLT